MKEIRKIVLTGGPCAGKSTAIAAITKHFSALGYRVLAVSETASDLLKGGISPFNIDNVTFQYIVTSTMRFKESMMQLAAETAEQEKVLIVCDRAQMDNTAYMTKSQFSQLCARMNTNRVEMRDGYDAVFHLETAAKADPQAYNANFASNPARYETAAAAIETDSAVLRGWVGHPHLRIIPSDTSFDRKMQKLIAETEAFLGIHGSLEIERRFLIKRPSDELLNALPFAECIDIEQSYIKNDAEKFRIRKRGEGGNYIYIRTDKKRITDITREEKEYRLTEEQYKQYLQKSYASLEKKRWCICDGGKYFELDVYPYSDEYALLELELTDENESFVLPDFCDVLREVTNDKNYTNKSIAEKHSLS